MERRAIDAESIEEKSAMWKQPWFWRLWLVATAVSMSSTFQVYHTAIINNLFEAARPMLERQYESNDSVIRAWALMTSSVLIGKFFGTIAGAQLADRIGRRATMIVVKLVYRYNFCVGSMTSAQLQYFRTVFCLQFPPPITFLVD